MKFLPTVKPVRPSPRFLHGGLFSVALFLAVAAPSARATLVEWGTTLDTSRLTTSGSVTYVNVNGEGYDINVVTQSLNGEGAGNFGIAGGPVSSWWFEGKKNTTSSSVIFRFYETGTTTAITLTGVHFKFEDAEVGEQFYNLGYWDSLGSLQTLEASSSIFSGTSPGLSTTLSPYYLQNNAAYAGQTQAGKALDVDLSEIAISGFRFNPLRTNNSAGSVEMTGLGDLQVFVVPAPEPNTALFGLAITGVLSLVRRRPASPKFCKVSS